MKKVIGLAIFALILSLGLVFNTSSVSAQTAGAGVLAATVDVGNTPDSKIVIAGSTMQKVGSFKFTAQNASFTIQDLRVKTFGESNNSSITSVTLKYKDAGGLEKTASQPLTLSSAGGLATYTGLSAFIPQNTNRDIDVYVDVSTIASGANSGALIIVSLDSSGGFKAFDSNGNVDTTLASQDLSSFVTSGKGMFVVRRSTPTISAVPLDSEILRSGANEAIGRVRISANTAGDIGWMKLAFTYNKSVNITLNTLKLYNQITNAEILGTFSNPATGQLIFTTTNEEQIAAGSSVTYELRATVGGLGVGVDTVVVSIANTSTTGVTASAYTAGATGPVSPSFIWTDRSASAISGGTVHSLNTLDWTNDLMVKTLPLTIGSKSNYGIGDGTVTTPVVTPPTTDDSALIAQLQALIAQLLEQLKAQGYVIDASGNLVRVPVVPIIPPVYDGGAFCYNWTTNLSYRSEGPAVIALNEALSRENISERLAEDVSVFDELTAGHVMAFQVKYSIPRTGVVGPVTRAKLNALYGCSQTEKFMDFDTATRFNVVNYSGSEETFFLAVYNTAGNVVPLDTFNFPNIAVGDYSIKAMYRNTNNNHDYLTARLAVTSGEMMITNIRSGTKDSNGTLNFANQNIEIRMSIDGKYLKIELREQNRDPQIFRINLSQNGTSILPLLSTGIGPYFNSNPGNYVLKAYEVRASGEVSDEGTFGLTVNNDHKSFTVKEITQVQPPISDVTATVTGTPTLELIYDASQKESSLRAIFDVTVNGGSNGVRIPVGENVSNFNLFQGANQAYVNSMRASVTASNSNTNPIVIAVNTDGTTSAVVPVNGSLSFRVVGTVDPRQLFAGEYTARLAEVVSVEIEPSGFKTYTKIPVVSNTSRGRIAITNPKIIVGEVSPYIKSVTNPVVPGQNVEISGQRLNAFGNTGPLPKVLIDNVVIDSGNSYYNNDGLKSGFTAPTTLANGRHSLQIENSVTGKSNIAWFEVGDPSLKATLEIKVTSSENNFSVGTVDATIAQITLMARDGDVALGEITSYGVPANSKVLNRFSLYDGPIKLGETSVNSFSANSIINVPARVTISKDTTKILTLKADAVEAGSVTLRIAGGIGGQPNADFRTIFGTLEKTFIVGSSSTPVSGATVTADVLRETGDKVGNWYTFSGDNVKDWVWNMRLSLTSGKKIKAISIVHGDYPYNSGEAWSTGSSQSLQGKLLYPLVVTTIRGEVQLNSSYDQMYSPNSPSPAYGSFEFPAGNHTLKLYGNTGATPFRGGKIIVDFTDSTSVGSLISASDYVPVSVPSTTLSVDLKINSLDNPGTVPYGTPAKISWTSTGARYCNTYGLSTLQLTDGTRWDNYSLPTSGSKSFIPPSNLGAATIGIQCWGNSTTNIQDKTEDITVSFVTATSSTTYHPADTNRDGRITISEVTTYRALAGSDTAAAQVASEIWRRGEVYTYDTVTNSFRDASGSVITLIAQVAPSISSVMPQPAVIGSNVTISGSGLSALSKVRIDGKYYNSIITSVNATNGQGNISFVMPSSLGSPCLVYGGQQCTGIMPEGGYPSSAGAHVIAIANSNSAVSNEVSFHVGTPVGTPPSITVSSPNGGEVISLGGSHTIRWISSNIASNVTQAYILLTDASGLDKVYITQSVPLNQQSFLWSNIGNNVSGGLPVGNYKIKMATFDINTGSFNTYDLSDSSFTITAPTPVPTTIPTITFNINGQPIASVTQVTTGTNMNLTWTSTGADYCEARPGGSFDTVWTGEKVRTLGSQTVAITSDMSGMKTIAIQCRNTVGWQVVTGLFSVVPPVTPVPVLPSTPAPDVIVTPAPQAVTIAQPTLSASLSQVYEDRAGRWGGFVPGTNSVGKANDFVWNSELTLGESKTIKSIDINHNVGGEYWSSSNTGAYPLVVVANNAQINTAYGQTLGTYGAGTANLTIYGQFEQSYFSGGTIKVTFTDNTTVSATIPAVSTFSPGVPSQSAAAIDAMSDILKRMLQRR